MGSKGSFNKKDCELKGEIYVITQKKVTLQHGKNR